MGKIDKYIKQTSHIINLCDQIYEERGSNSEINDIVGNYANKTISLLNLLEYKEGFEKGIKILEDFLYKRISLEDFKKLKSEEDNSIDEIIEKYGDLTKEAKTEIILYLKSKK